MIEDRPDECKEFGLAHEKDRIKEDYYKEWGEQGSAEHAVIVIDSLKENQKKEQESLDVHERTTTKMDLTLLIVFFILATVGAFYYRNRREKAITNQQVHDTVNEQVKQYF